MVQQLSPPTADTVPVTPAAAPPPAVPVVETPAAVAPAISVETAPQTGAPTETVASPAAPAPISPEVQGYIDGLQRDREEAQRVADQATLQDFVVNRTLYYEQQEGLTPEQAQKLARRDGELGAKAWQAEEFRRGQFNAEMEIGGKYKVDPRRLMHLSSPRAMAQAAEAMTQQGKVDSELAALRAEVARLKKAPAQSFANGVVSGDGTRLTSDNIDVLYAQGKVSDATYKAFLRTGRTN